MVLQKVLITQVTGTILVPAVNVGINTARRRLPLATSAERKPVRQLRVTAAHGVQILVPIMRVRQVPVRNLVKRVPVRVLPLVVARRFIIKI